MSRIRPLSPLVALCLLGIGGCESGSDPATPDASASEPSGADAGDTAAAWSCGAFACEEVDVTTSSGSMLPLDGCHFELALEASLEEGEALADALLARLESGGLGSRRSLEEVLGDLNREGQAGLSSETTSRLSGLDPVGFRWNDGDDRVSYWYPQGTTGTSDATAEGRLDGRRLIMTSWYHKTDERPTKGVRISLADITDLDEVRYRHLLLVDPYEADDGIDFGPAEYDSGNALHAGGIAWWGHYLYVADTIQGMRIYDLSRIFAPTNYDDTERVGVSADRSDAHGYAYAVPRIARYRLTEDSCRIRFAFIGLERDADPPALITGEYFSDHPSGKLAVWPMDAATGLLETRRGTTRASEAMVIGQTRAQGALRVGDDVYISSSSQDLLRNGKLYRNRPGEQSTDVNWVYGCEDLYYERHEDLVWTSAEHPGRRDVVAIPRPID